MKLTFALAVCLLLCAGKTSGQRLIRNGDFESWGTYSTGDDSLLGYDRFPYWPGSLVTYEYVARTPDTYSGDAALMLRPYRIAAFKYPDFPFTSGTTLYRDTLTTRPKRLRGFYKLQADTFLKSAGVSVTMYNDSSLGFGGFIGGGSFATSIPTASWMPFTVEFEYPYPDSVEEITVSFSVMANDTNANPYSYFLVDSVWFEFTDPDTTTSDTPATIATPQQEQHAQPFTIYPNPVTTEALNLSPAPSPAAHIELTDPAGRSIPFTCSGATLYLPPALPPGLYLLHIKDKEGRSTLKFLKE